ncbi:MAG TPA: PIG-L family deacetylase [Thermoanaerobaculia bacterium]|nr:PIG-L family deacetylase [Thermoanaerobaculia bacterium]
MKLRTQLAAISTLLATIGIDAATPPKAPMNSARLQLAISKLNVLSSALYIAAHPDDENTAMLAYLSDEKLARTAYLSVTRGDGGQNLIGSEKGELIGLLRTEELMEARQIDGAEQFFTRAIDFGYSKSPEETLQIWGKQSVLSDMVWVIRHFRPDVLITRFPTNGAGGHGQHTASAILAAEAFNAAGDPTRFPEQLKHVQPWKPKRLLHNNWRPNLQDRPATAPKLIQVDLGRYNPLLGKSYTEIAADSRSMHKSQGFGSAERRGSIPNYLENLAGEAPVRDEIFDGIDTTWARVPGGAALSTLFARVKADFDPANPSGIMPLLLEAHRELERLKTNPWAAAKQRELLEVIRASAGLWIEAIASKPLLVAGAESSITATVVKRSDVPMRLETVGLAYGNPSQSVNLSLKNNEPVKVEVAIKLPAELGTTNPYWLDATLRKGTYEVTDLTIVGMPANRPALPVMVTLASGSDTLFYEVPAVYRRTDPVRGEQYRDVVIAPSASLNFRNKVLLFSDRTPKIVAVTVQSHQEKELSGELRLVVPSGWSVSPEVVPVSIKSASEQPRLSFTVTPPVAASSGLLTADLKIGDQHFTRSVVNVDYPHITPQTTFPTAVMRLVRADVKIGKSRVGYVAGSGDDVAEALSQIGYSVSMITDEELSGESLSKYDVIVTGIRAYNTRRALGQSQTRLLDYVKNGGRVVVQYNTAQELLVPNPAPFPLKMSNERVTTEDAAVTILDPANKLLSTPNKISAADFDGWVQERGLYFPSEWDAAFSPLLAMNDPGEPERRGSLLVAPYGKGLFIYTGLSFFRQLPAGVPGAYRLFANLVAAERR